MNYKKLNDYELIYLIKEKNEEARNILLEKYQPIIKSMANSYYKKNISKGIELDDFLQEGYYSFFKAIDTFKEDKNVLFYTYVVKCLERAMSSFNSKINSKRYDILNKAFSYEVKEDVSQQPYINVISDDKEPLSEIMEEEFYNTLNNFKLDLKAEYSVIFELKYNGFTTKEISILLDITPTRIYHCLNKIRQAIKKKNLNQFLLDYQL